MQPTSTSPPRLPPLPLPPLAVDTAGVVSADVPCRGCSYNLRGLHQDSRCPECAIPVGLSIRGNLLRYCNPHWVARVWGGVIISLVGIAAVALLSCIWPLGVPFRTLQYWLSFGVGAVTLLGTWLLTTPDPGGQERPSVVRTRLIARIALLVALGRSILALYRNSPLDPKLSALVGVGFLIVALARVVGEIARLSYLRQLALRLPDDGLASDARMLMWWYGGLMGVSQLIGAGFTFMALTLKQPPASFGAGFTVMWWSMRLALLALCFLGIRYMVM